MPVSKINCATHVLARTAMRQLKHAMNFVGDAVHRFALPKGATQTAIETRMTRSRWSETKIELYPRANIITLIISALEQVFVHLKIV